MKTILLFTLLSSTLTFAQSDFKISELKSRYKKSILHKTNDPLFTEQLPLKMIQQYICLKKHYKVKFNEQSSFLTEKEFVTKYKSQINSETPALYLAEKKDFMYNLMNSDYEYRMQIQKLYSKCIPIETVNW